MGCNQGCLSSDVSDNESNAGDIASFDPLPVPSFSPGDSNKHRKSAIGTSQNRNSIISATQNSSKFPQNPVGDTFKLPKCTPFAISTSNNHHHNNTQSLSHYRAKRVSVYKPNLGQLQSSKSRSSKILKSKPSVVKSSEASKSRKSVSIKHNNNHSRDKSKDDLSLHMNLRRCSRLYSFKMPSQMDTDCVTDIEDESDDDFDNVTVVRHDSVQTLHRHESNDSFWDKTYSQNKSTNHCRTTTYHCYGGDDDDGNNEQKEQNQVTEIEPSTSQCSDVSDDVVSETSIDQSVEEEEEEKSQKMNVLNAKNSIKRRSLTTEDLDKIQRFETIMIEKGIRKKKFRKKRMSILASSIDENVAQFSILDAYKAQLRRMNYKHPSSPTFSERMKMYQRQTNNLGFGQLSTRKLKQIKAERMAKDEIMTLSDAQRQKAAILLQQYATNKSEHIADITLIDETMRGVITKENCLSKLEKLSILTFVYVPINEFERWNNRNFIANAMNKKDDNRRQFDENPKNFVKMCNLTLLNSKILIKLADEQKEKFQKLLLFGIESCQNLYKINFNASNICNNLLIEILTSLSVRNENDKFFGPEMLLIENNAISDRGIQRLCTYVCGGNNVHLKCLKVGHCFGTISTKCSQLFCDSLHKNEHILKVTFDMRWAQHRQSVDKALKRNYANYRKEQKKLKSKALLKLL